MRDYSLSAILSDFGTDNESSEILDSSKSYDVKDFITGLQGVKKPVYMKKAYYGKMPEIVNEDKKWNEKLDYGPLQYCPVGIVLDTNTLYNADQIKEIYPFDPQIIRNEDIEQKYFRLSFHEMKKYIELFYGNNKYYFQDKYVEIKPSNIIIEFLNNLHNPEHYGNYSENRFEPKRTAITFLLKEIKLTIDLIKEYPKLIKLIIIPEKLKEYTVIQDIIALLPPGGCITYETKPFHAPSYYNMTVENIFDRYISGEENYEK